MGLVSANTADPEQKLSAEALQLVCGFLYRRTGMSYGEPKRYYIERRVAAGMVRAQSTSFGHYLARLQIDEAEAEALINSFTVNETYFLREEHQLRCLVGALLPEIVARRSPGDQIRIWSAPCSTGEEPYSIAIWLLEHWKLVDAYNVEIVGSDLDTRVLAAGLAGYYGDRALARMSAELSARYFEPARNGTRRIIQDLRESVRFTTVNLVEAATVAAQGAFDVVFCRNVLIYFDASARQMAIRHLYEALRPGGFICLGHAESMVRISDLFELRRFEEAIVYQRPLVDGSGIRAGQR